MRSDVQKLVGGPDQADEQGTRSAIGRWIGSDPLRQLAELFGFVWPTGAGLNETVAELEAWSAGVWDFRRGRERWDATPFSAAPDTITSIEVLAGELGLTGATMPTIERADVIVILGGGFLTPLYRSRHAAMAASALNCTRIVSLGTGRPLAGEREIRLSSQYAPDAASEFELMEAAARSAFDLSSAAAIESGIAAGSGDQQHRLWQHSIVRENGVQLDVLRAPSTDPTRRANTRDTYRFLIDRIELGKSPTILVATTSIFVPFQHFDALNIIGDITQATIETVGFDVVTGPNPAGPNDLLQEVRSGIFSANVALSSAQDH